MQNFQLFFIISSFILGSAIGSFLNVVILRLPLEKSLEGRSYCFHCKRHLSYLDLFPILSFIFLGGKCRYCKAKISARYFVIELITAILFALVTFIASPTNLIDLLVVIKYFIVISSLIVVFVIDWEHFLIFDSVILTSSIFILIVNSVLDIINGNIFNLHGYLISGLIAGLLAFLPFFGIWFFSKGRWMGFGDVKLVILLGLMLGFPNIFVGLMVSVLLGGVVSICLLVFTKKTLTTQIPFGTFLSIGTFISLVYGTKLLNWYLSFLGF